MYNNPPELKGLKTEDIFLLKIAPNPALFCQKIGQNLALSSIKWHKKNLIGENGGERKINPSANPVNEIQNQAEKRELNNVKKVHIFSDSQCAIGHLSLGWEA